MRITLSELRQIIREAMVTELEPGMKIRIEHSGNTLGIMIMKQGVPRAHSPGGIRLRKRAVDDGSIWEVESSGAQRGWGPLLYDLAMEYVSYDIGDLGITPDSVTVSTEARGVWEHYFNRRGDVEKDPLPKSMLYQAGDRPEYLRYYYYKLSRPLLDKFEAQGLVEIV